MMSMAAGRRGSAAEQAALRDQCSVSFADQGRMTAADLLASIPADTATNHYGDGGAVAKLETEIAGLAKPAAVACPAGRWPSSRCSGSTPTGASAKTSSSTRCAIWNGTSVRPSSACTA